MTLRTSQGVGVVACALIALAGHAHAGIIGAGPIDDVSAFNAYPNAQEINFETDGDGNDLVSQFPVLDTPGGTQTMSGPDEYLPAPGGVRLFADDNGTPTPLDWVNDGTLASGLPDITEPIAIPGSRIGQGFGSFQLEFDTPVDAFGFFVVNNDLADADGPTMRIFDTADVLIATITFAPDFVDNSFANLSRGFMGYAALPAPDQRGTLQPNPIKRVEIDFVHAIFDDLNYTPIPTPGALALAAVAATACVRRRR